MAGARFRIDDEAARGWTLIAPPAVYALLLLAIPLGTIFAFTFWTQDFLTIAAHLHLDELSSRRFTDPLYRELMLRSILIAGAVTIATVLTAFPVAYFVSFRVPPERKALWIFLITIPFWTSYLIRVFLWKVILGFNGVLNTTLQGLGLIDEPLSFILYNANAVVITLAHAYRAVRDPADLRRAREDRPLAARGVARPGRDHGLDLLPRDAAAVDAGVVAAALIVFIPTIGDYVTPRLVGGPDGLMIANMIQTQFLRLNNAPLGATLAVAGDGGGRPDLAGVIVLLAPRRAEAAVRGGALRIYTLAYLIFLYAPIFLLPIFAFNDSQIIAFPLAGFSTRWFRELATVEALHDAVLTSLFIAVTFGGLVDAAGHLRGAGGGALSTFPASGRSSGFIMLPLVLPEIIVAVSLLT